MRGEPAALRAVDLPDVYRGLSSVRVVPHPIEPEWSFGRAEVELGMLLSAIVGLVARGGIELALTEPQPGRTVLWARAGAGAEEAHAFERALVSALAEHRTHAHYRGGGPAWCPLAEALARSRQELPAPETVVTTGFAEELLLEAFASSHPAFAEAICALGSGAAG